MTTKEALHRPLVLGVLVATAVALAGASAAAVARLRTDAPYPAVTDTPAVDTLAADAPLSPYGALGPLTDLAVRRIQLADQVAAAKLGTDMPVDAPARERQELAAVRRKAADLGLDPAATAAFFQDQIDAGKTVQRTLLARWREHPDEAPAQRPALDAVRARLDALTEQLLRELVATRQIRRPTASCLADLAQAATGAATARGLDPLHRAALGTALRSVCSTA